MILSEEDEKLVELEDLTRRRQLSRAERDAWKSPCAECGRDVFSSDAHFLTRDADVLHMLCHGIRSKRGMEPRGVWRNVMIEPTNTAAFVADGFEKEKP